MTDFIVSKEALELYKDYTYERSNVYYLKEVLKSERPWTRDILKHRTPHSDKNILDQFKFTAHRRELDRESRFLIRTVCENAEITLDEKILNCALFRMFNCQEGTTYLKGWPVKFNSLNIQEYYDFESSIESSKMNFQSNAYFLSSCRRAGNQVSNSKYKGFQSNLVNFIHQNMETILTASKQESPEKVLEVLWKIDSFGQFLTYQIYQDFTYCTGYHLDNKSFVQVGPGAMEGIDWMVGIEAGDWENHPGLIKNDPHDNKKVIYGSFKVKYPENTYEDFLYWFQASLPRLMSENNLQWNPKEFQHYLPESQQDWGLSEVQNSLCEYNKLSKLINNVNMRVRYYG